MTDKKTIEEHTYCLYWSQKNKECTLTRGGLFIPMTNHIKAYCQTSRFFLCRHYIRGSKLLEEEAQDYPYKFGGGRRRYSRKKDCFSVILESCDQAGKPVEIFDKDAYVMDLGIGGVRLESSKEIPPVGLLAFTFGPDFIIPDLKGFGEVRWSGSVPDSENFQAGLSFADNAIKQAIGARMTVSDM